MALPRSERPSVELPTSPVLFASPSRHRFTVSDYYRMAEIGVLTEDSKVQLVDGVIFDMPPIGPGHASSVERISEMFRGRLGADFQVRVQNPVDIGPNSQPEPDVVVVPRRDDYYRDGHPTPVDVLLLIEVADSTLRFDRSTKTRSYARAAVVEYWIANIVGDEVIVHRDPARGRYRSVQVMKRGDTIRPLAFPDVSISISDVLGEES
jgi:Uma2 family endonuclease